MPKTDGGKTADSKRKREKIRINQENAISYYANSLEVATSNWDFRLKGGEILEANDERLVIKDLFTIYLAPSHAKAISIILSKKVKEYEQKLNVNLPVPDVFLKEDVLKELKESESE